MNSPTSYLRIFLFTILFSISYCGVASYDTQHDIDSLTIELENTDLFEEKKKLLTALSNCYQNQGDWEGYHEIIDKMFLLQEEKVDSFYLAETYNKLGISSCILGKNIEALDYFDKALKINLAQKMYIIAATSYENLGAVHKDMSNYKEAAECQLKSLEIRKEKDPDNPRIFNNYLKLSTILESLGDEEQMNHYIDLAKREMSRKGRVTPRKKALFYNQLGDMYNRKGLVDSSIICYRSVVANSKLIGWNMGVAQGLGNLADIYFQEGLLDSSVVYHRESLRLSQKISNRAGESESYRFIAKLNIEMGRLDSVVYYLNKVLEVARGYDLQAEETRALKQLSEFYRSQDNYEKAYSYMQAYQLIEDQIASAAVKNSITEIEAKYETREKEKQIEILRAEDRLKTQKIWLYIAITLIVILTLIFGVIVYCRRRKESVQDQEILKQQLFRSQMNPHFLFNALSSIQDYMLKNETTKAAGYLNNFAKLTRNVLEHSTQELVPLSDEIDTLQNYIELERMRFNNSFDFDIKYDEDLELDFIDVPPMLIQPFVENSIKHGLSMIDSRGVLELEFKEIDSMLLISISDNGIGIDSSKRDLKYVGYRSMSMEIFEQRKAMLTKKIKRPISVDIVDKQTLTPSVQGTLVSIAIPLVN